MRLITGEYSLTVKDKNGNIKHEYSGENAITYAGLARLFMFISSQYYDYRNYATDAADYANELVFYTEKNKSDGISVDNTGKWKMDESSVGNEYTAYNALYSKSLYNKEYNQSVYFEETYPTPDNDLTYKFTVNVNKTSDDTSISAITDCTHIAIMHRLDSFNHVFYDVLERPRVMNIITLPSPISISSSDVFEFTWSLKVKIPTVNDLPDSVKTGAWTAPWNPVAYNYTLSNYNYSASPSDFSDRNAGFNFHFRDRIDGIHQVLDGLSYNPEITYKNVDYGALASSEVIVNDGNCVVTDLGIEIHQKIKCKLNMAQYKTALKSALARNENRRLWLNAVDQVEFSTPIELPPDSDSTDYTVEIPFFKYVFGIPGFNKELFNEQLMYYNNYYRNYEGGDYGGDYGGYGGEYGYEGPY